MKTSIKYGLVFLTGFISCILILQLISISSLEKPVGFSINGELEAPGDWINLDQIKISENRIVLDIPNASISKYAPTGSMKPLLDSGANGIRIVPSDPNQINVGDIITFGDEYIVHRVIEKGEDEEGIYFITQGDNNAISDGEVRFEDIKYVTIGILY